MHTLFTWTGRIVLTGIAFGAVFILVSQIPIEGNYEFRIVESGSMEPALKTGSIVAVIPRDTYREGDIITFSGTQSNPTPTTHRIVGTQDAGGQTVFLTKGDANEEADHRRISQSEIRGKVFLTVPYAGYVAWFMGTPDGMAFVVVAGVLLITVPPLMRYIRRQQTHHEDIQ